MYQKLIVIGNLGKEPETRFTPGGYQVCNFSVAANRSFQKDGEWQKETTWFNVTVWGKRAEYLADKLHKGNLVMIEGRMNEARGWTGKDGEVHASNEITADKVMLLERKQEVNEEIPF